MNEGTDVRMSVDNVRNLHDSVFREIPILESEIALFPLAP